MGAFALLIVATGCGRPGAPEWGGLQPTVLEPAPIRDPAAATRSVSERLDPVPAPAGGETAWPLFAAVADPGGPTAPPPSLVAHVVVPEISVFGHPGGRYPVASFTRQGTFGEPRVFLVREARPRWLRVLLPIRPNGTEGWIKRQDVRISRHRFAVRVDLSERRLWVRRRATVILRTSVSVGRGESPTPTGLFFTSLPARATDPAGSYGPFAYGLSGYSEVYTEFAGGNGQIAIHGTNAPQLIGQAVSAGCVRVPNRIILRLAEILPLGTPVRIVR